MMCLSRASTALTSALLLLLLALTVSAERAAAAPAPAQAPASGARSAVLPYEPRAHLERIMQDPLFQRWERRQMRGERLERLSDTWYADALRSLRERIGAFFDWLFGRDRRGAAANPGGAGSAMGPVMQALALLLAVVLIGFLLLTIVRLLRERGQPQHAATVTRARIREALESGEALAVASPHWLDEADRLAARNNLRLAFRAIYLSLLAGLHEHKKIDFRRHRTNWTYVSHYRGPDDERATLAELTAVFDDAWYGQRPPDRGTFERIRWRVRGLLGREAGDA